MRASNRLMKSLRATRTERADYPPRLQKNGAKSWTGLPTDEEMEQLRNERYQRRHADEDRRAASRAAELQKLKDEVMEVTRRNRRNSRD